MKCARCEIKAAGEVGIKSPKSRKSWALCSIHRERLEYIIKAYLDAPPHRVAREP